jgi:hypothetical protein
MVWAAFLVISVSHISVAETGESAVALPPDMVVAMIRSRCYRIECPHYEVTVFDNGRVELLPGGAVTARDRKSWKIAKTAVAEIKGLLDELRVLDLKDKYDYGEPSCQVFWTDGPSVYLTIHHRGVWKFVHHNLGCRDSTDVSKLERLEQAIDRISGAERAVR